MTDEHKPDKVEKGLRFGCGLLMGATLAFAAGFQFSIDRGDTWLISIILTALVFAFLALRYGDHFWHRLLDVLRWW